MDPAMLPRIFELFAQVDGSLGRAQGGLGIGLTLVRSLAEMHGGAASAHSDGPGRGSEFVVTLPAAEGPAAEPAGGPRATTPASARAPGAGAGRRRQRRHRPEHVEAAAGRSLDPAR